MSGEYETPVWLAESIAQLEGVRVNRPMPAQELRRQSVRRRTRSAALTAIAVATLTAGAYWNYQGADQATGDPTHHGEASRISAAKEKLRSYYSVLPDAFASRDSTPEMWNLMTAHFTDTALKREAVLERSGADELAATCGQVEATTTFSVGDPRSTGVDTVRSRVTSSSAPGSIEVDFDLRTMRITKWSCPDGT